MSTWENSPFFIMSNRRLSSPYFRYLKARLWNLARPGFWGTAIFLSVIGLTIREFWMRPDMFTSRQSKPAATQADANSTLSAEDRAIVADIDNLSVLQHDSKQVAQPPLDTAEPISQPRTGSQNPLQQAVKNQNTSNDTKLSSNSSAPTPSVKYVNPFLTQAENLLQFGNPLRNGNDGFVGLNTANSSNQSNQPNQLTIGLDQTKNGNSTQRPVAANSLEAALSSLSLNPSPSQTQAGQVVNRNQSIIQPNNLLPSSNNINSLSQGINNSASPTQLAQPNTITQPQTVNSNLNGANQNQPFNYGNLNGVNSTQPANYGNLNGINSTQPSNYGSLNGTNQNQPSNYNNLNGANQNQLTNYNGNLNGLNPAQPVNDYRNSNSLNAAQTRIYNNFNNILPLQNSNFVPQTTVNTTPTTVTPSTSNTVSYPTTTNTPTNTAGNGTLITPAQPNLLPQYPNSGLPIRY